MLVSSRHMMLASPVFRAMLDGNFKEGCDLTSNGKVQVPLPDDDPEAFAIVLDIIHGHNRRVPREVELELLTEISILVDKYQIYEAVEFFAESWIEGLNFSLPRDYWREKKDVHTWIAISWVFDHSSEFKSMTKLTGRATCAGLVDDVDDRLPFPTSILESIEHQREKALQAAYSFIDDTISAYQGTKLLCPSPVGFFQANQIRCPSHEASRVACDSMVLGSLLKSLVKGGVWPAPTSPYKHETLDDLCDSIRCLNLVSLCDQLQPPKKSSYPPVGECHGLSAKLRENVEKQRERISGLDLQNFKKATGGSSVGN
ncbi:hypothetical protein NA56DRAFT_565466 [Hyaloscypha hepaticicola]|uniref:Uncharacterized protein n=1 Tax=Hyaloscypha hepaticicola TaxID=2082293 RepID=A0A2J6QGQ7_9HELO|nr:hypothetical protein NA56DRAFT_565466 [Hyaloscypha hepaticicola]